MGVPDPRGAEPRYHLGDLLTALADGITELCLRHPHLLAVGGKLLDERTDQFTLLFGLYKLRHNFPNFLFINFGRLPTAHSCNRKFSSVWKNP